MIYKIDEELEKFISNNENALFEIWDNYKYEHYCGELFHYDDVDWFNEELFEEMCFNILESGGLKNVC